VTTKKRKHLTHLLVFLYNGHNVGGKNESSNAMKRVALREHSILEISGLFFP